MMSSRFVCFVAALSVAVGGSVPAQTGRAPGKAGSVVEVQLAAGAPVCVCYQVHEPSLGAQGVGWSVQNLTQDRIEVRLEKSYHAGQRVAATKTGSVVVEPGQTLRGGRFFGDSCLDLWDDLLYPENLRNGERISRVAARVSWENRSEQQRQVKARERAEQIERERERTRRLEQEREQRARLEEQRRGAERARERRDAEREAELRALEERRAREAEEVERRRRQTDAARQRADDEARRILEGLEQGQRQRDEIARELERRLREIFDRQR